MKNFQHLLGIYEMFNYMRQPFGTSGYADCCFSVLKVHPNIEKCLDINHEFIVLDEIRDK